MKRLLLLFVMLGFLVNIWALERMQRISFDLIKSKPQEVFDLIEGQEEYINNHLEDARRCRGSVECHELMLHLTSQALVSFMELKNHPRLAELKSVDISPWWSVFGFFTKNAYERYMELEGRIEKDLIVLVNLNPAAYVKIEALDGYGWEDEYRYCRTDILGAYVNYAFFSAVAYRLLHLDSKGLDNLQEEIKEVLRVFPTQKEQKNAFAALATLYKELYTIELIKIPKVDKNSLHYVNDNLIKPGIQELRSVVKALIDSELDGLMIDAGIQLAAKKMQESLLRKLLRGALNVASISNELGTYLTVYQKGISNVMENFEEIFWYLDAWSALKSCQGRLATHCLGSIEESEWYVIQRSNGEFYILPEAKPFLDKLETRWKLYHLLALSPSLAYKYVKEEASSSQSSVSSSSSSFAASSVKPLKASFEIKGKQTLYVGDEIEIISTSDKSLEHLWYIQAPSGKSMSVRNRVKLRYRLKEAGRYRIVLRVSDGERSDRAEKFVDVVRPPATVTKIKNYKEWLLGSETKGVDGRKGWSAGLRREDGWCVNVGVRKSNGCLNVEGEVEKINLFLIDTTDRNEPIGIAARLRRPPTIKKIRDSVLWDDYDWVGEDNYRSNETIAIRNPRQGTYYFAAYAFEDFHNAKIYFEVKTIQKEQVLQSSSSSSSSMSSSSTSSISSAGVSSYGSSVDMSGELHRGLVAWYQFEGNAKDSSGNGNNGTEYGGVIYIDGIIGKAAKFDGEKVGYIDFGQSSDFILNQKFSISFFARIEKKGIIIDKDVIGTRNDDWFIAVNRKGQIYFSFGNESVLSTKNIFNDWHHFVFVRDKSSGKLKIFIDGKLDVVKGGYYNNLLAKTNFIVGAWDTPRGFTNGITGLIDELRIYNRILNEVEIETLHNLGKNVGNNSDVQEICKAKGGIWLDGVCQYGADIDKYLVAWYQFEGNLIDSVNDRGGVERVANVTYIVSPFGQGVKFSGVKDYRIEIEPYMPAEESFSICGWFKVDSLEDFPITYQAPIISEQDGDFSNGFVLRLEKRNAQVYLVFLIGDAISKQYIRHPLPKELLGQWNFVSAVLDRDAKRIHLYLNGNRVVGDILRVGPIYPSEALIGAYDYKYARNGHPRFVSSRISIDELRIFKRALNESEVNRLYKAAKNSNDIIQNHNYVNTLYSYLDSLKKFDIQGYFYNYDFNHNGKIEYNDWVLVTPDGDAYRLLGVAPTQDNAFGFQPISLPKGLANKEPMGYFIYLGFSQDSDKRFSWLYVTRDGYVYKLMGANADGTFRYLDIDGNGRVDALEELKITITDPKPLSIDFASQKSIGRLTSQTSQIEQTPPNPIEKYIGNWKGTSKVWLINQPNVYCIWQWDVRIDANKKGSLSARLIERRNDQGYCATSGYAAFEITNVSDYGFSYRLTQTSTSVFGGSERGYFQVMNNNSVKEEKSMNIAGYPAKRLSILYKQ